MKYDDIAELLGDEADSLLGFTNPKVDKESLAIPGPDWVSRVYGGSDRPPRVLTSLQALFNHGRLGGTGYLSVLPVDQGVEHSAGASFTPNPEYFDPERVVELAIEGGCSAVASTLGVLGSCARKYAHRIPFILKLNHNELLSYPNTYDQVLFARVKQAFDMGAAAVGATIYFGSEESPRRVTEISDCFSRAHELGMATVLWCYLRNSAFKKEEADYHSSADLTGQANYLGSTIQADIVKQKLPTLDGGYIALNRNGISYGKYSGDTYEKLCSGHPVDMARYQVLNNFAGRVGLINSGGSSGKNDLKDVVRTAVINKRAGGMGLITGRKTFQRPMAEGVRLFHAIQDVYLCGEVKPA